MKYILALILTFIILSTNTELISAQNYYNCDDFLTQEEAQDEFESNYYDINYLDGDDDGIACEALPSSYESYADEYGSNDYYESETSDTNTSSFTSNEYESRSDYSSDNSESSDYSWLWWILGIGIFGIFSVFSD